MTYCNARQCLQELHVLLHLTESAYVFRKLCYKHIYFMLSCLASDASHGESGNKKVDHSVHKEMMTILLIIIKIS